VNKDDHCKKCKHVLLFVHGKKVCCYLPCPQYGKEVK
jgi:hypothetical protein